jgi:hypothetical protein
LCLAICLVCLPCRVSLLTRCEDGIADIFFAEGRDDDTALDGLVLDEFIGEFALLAIKEEVQTFVPLVNVVVLDFDIVYAKFVPNSK